MIRLIKYQHGGFVIAKRYDEAILRNERDASTPNPIIWKIPILATNKLMKTVIFLINFLLVASLTYSQSYKDSMEQYQKNYVLNHEVVKADDKKLMQFFPVSQQYKVVASFEKIENGGWFQMPTSGKLKKIYRVYGVLKFRIKDSILQLNLLQSQDLMSNEKYKNFLFLH